MDITFLVGNGFDISAGIDTSYASFYNWYLAQPSRTPSIQHLKDNIKNDIVGEGKNWSDFEIGLGQYTSHFTLENIDDFFTCYEDAHEQMLAYLQRQRATADFSALSSRGLDDLRDAMTHFYAELNPREASSFQTLLSADPSESKKLSFISFNYTDVLDTCVKHLSERPLSAWVHRQVTQTFYVDPEVIHVHGDSNIYPILGVNDESQIANQALLSNPRFREIMIKPQSVNSIGQFWHRDAEKLIARSKIICIWGMSLGESDAKWWAQIISWLKGDPNRRLIIFWHTPKDIGTISILKRSRAIEAAKASIIRYSELPVEETQNIASRVHIITNTQKVLRVSLKAKKVVLAK